MPTKPKTEQINKKISAIVDKNINKKLDSFDKTIYRRWLKVAELSIQLSEWLKALNSNLDNYLPQQELIDKKMENDLNKIKGEINDLQKLSELLKNICSTTMNRISSTPVPPPPPPPSKKIIKSTPSTPKSSTSRAMHDPLEIKNLANTMNKSRKEKLQEIEKKTKDLKKFMDK